MPKYKTVAIIDNDAAHMEYYCHALMSNGYDAVYFNSPASCLTALRKQERHELYVV